MASASMGQKLRVHLLVLPRPFGLPVALSSIALGGVLAGAPGGNLVLALLVGAFLMAMAHSFNSVSDWLIGFDRGPVGERSREKLYTSGQSLIATGRVSLGGAFLNSLFWLVAAYLMAALLAARSSPLVWVPVLGITACALTYSPAKKAWLCETVLGLGFGPFALMLGAAASPNPDLWRAFLAGIPLGILFGFAAETVDQAIDAPVNVEKGLKNLGLLAWGWNALPDLLALEISLAYLSLGPLVWAGILSPWSFLSLLAVPLLAFTVARVTTQTARAIRAGLLGIFLFGALITLGQIVGG